MYAPQFSPTVFFLDRLAWVSCSLVRTASFIPNIVFARGENRRRIRDSSGGKQGRTSSLSHPGRSSHRYDFPVYEAVRPLRPRTDEDREESRGTFVWPPLCRTCVCVCSRLRAFDVFLEQCVWAG